MRLLLKKKQSPFIVRIMSLFDVFEWWQDDTIQDEFPLIHLISCFILPMPESNDRMERVFSACTWYDTKLQRRQKSLTFETKALLYSNRSYIDTCMRHIESVNARLEANAQAQKILKEGASAFVPVVTDDEAAPEGEIQ